MLKDLSLKGVYKSDQDDILEDFYIPALSRASTYDRAVGYFSASTISCAGQALSAFIQNGGRARLILGAFTDQQDIDAVNQGIERRELSERIGQEFLGGIEGVTSELFERRFEALSWLVATGKLEIKVALRAHGLYHDKVGIITDAAGDAVVFTGSANESAQALLPTKNYESIDVFPTWRTELSDYFGPHKSSFERLWRNESRDTAVIDLPTAIAERLLKVANHMDGPPSPEKEVAIAARLFGRPREDGAIGDHQPRLPETLYGLPFILRDHQRDALREWQVRGDYHGIFDLATGAGKTITAIYGVVQMAKHIPGLTLVISAPYQNLADQWCEILEQFNIRPLQCYVSQASWEGKLESLVHEVEIGVRSFAAIVVVNRTLKNPVFQSALKKLEPSRFMWIGDECHHHSSESFEGFLPDNARYRIGLSATPEHYLDDDRNARLKVYYGEIVFSYTLAQAIEDKVLTPYKYYPRIVYLTEEEATDFIELCESIGKFAGRSKSSSGMPPALAALLTKRARIVASAQNKFPALRSAIAGKRPEQHSLFYCGDGRVDADADDAIEDLEGADARQIEALSQTLDSLGWRNARFTSHESRRDRDKIMRNFKVGLVDSLVAIKCLDEGIDVPACRTAYILASSRDPRQFIQRRGRILRRSAGKELAIIYDFVVVLPRGYEEVSHHAKKLVRSELERVAEFSRLSENRAESYDELRTVLQSYDLEHML